MTKKKKRNLIILCVVLAVVAFVSTAFVKIWPKSKDISESTVFQASQVEEQAKYIISLVDSDNYQTLNACMSGDMQTTLSQTALNQAKAKISEDFGEFKMYDSIDMSEMTQNGKIYAFAQVGVVYENVRVIYSLTFDTDMKLEGIYMK